MRFPSKKRKLIINVLAVAIPIFLVVVIYFGLRIALATDKPLVTVVGTSMSPTLEIGDLVIIRGVPATNIQVGDIIVFDPPQGVRTIHRVTRIQTLTNGTIQFRTKGDAVDQEDDWISEQYVHGRVIYQIPYLGYLILDPVVTAIVVIFLMVVILAWPERKRRFHRHKRI